MGVVCHEVSYPDIGYEEKVGEFRGMEIGDEGKAERLRDMKEVAIPGDWLPDVLDLERNIRPSRKNSTIYCNPLMEVGKGFVVSQLLFHFCKKFGDLFW